VKRDSRTIKCMKTRAPNKNFNNDLVYGALKLCCVHGDKDHKTVYQVNFPLTYILP
jgi:hypothetical protein